MSEKTYKPPRDWMFEIKLWAKLLLLFFGSLVAYILAIAGVVAVIIITARFMGVPI